MPLGETEGESLWGEDATSQRKEEELVTAPESEKCEVEQRIRHCGKWTFSHRQWWIPLLLVSSRQDVFLEGSKI